MQLNRKKMQLENYKQVPTFNFPGTFTYCEAVGAVRSYRSWKFRVFKAAWDPSQATNASGFPYHTFSIQRAHCVWRRPAPFNISMLSISLYRCCAVSCSWDLSATYKFRSIINNLFPNNRAPDSLKVMFLGPCGLWIWEMTRLPPKLPVRFGAIAWRLSLTRTELSLTWEEHRSKTFLLIFAHFFIVNVLYWKLYD